MPSPLDVFHPRHAGSPIQFSANDKAVLIPASPRTILLCERLPNVEKVLTNNKASITNALALGNALSSSKQRIGGQAVLGYFDAKNIAAQKNSDETNSLKGLYSLIRENKVFAYYWPYSLAQKQGGRKTRPKGVYVKDHVPTPDELEILGLKSQARAALERPHAAPNPIEYCPVEKQDVGSIEPIEGNPYAGLFKHYVSETTGGVVYGDTGSVNSLKLTPQDAADIRAFKEASPDGYAAATLIAPGSKLKKAGTTFIKKSATNDKITPSDLGKIKSLSSVNPSKTINGRKIVNGHLAGTIVKTKGGNVKFDKDGFPDFTPYSKKTVRVNGINGDMTNDVPLAMKKAGITTYDKKNMVWHHHQDGKTMMLIPRNVHSVKNGGVAHTGGRAVMQNNKNNPNNILNYASPKEVL